MELGVWSTLALPLPVDPPIGGRLILYPPMREEVRLGRNGLCWGGSGPRTVSWTLTEPERGNLVKMYFSRFVWISQYLSGVQNAFVQIVKSICPDFTIFWQRPWTVSWSLPEPEGGRPSEP